ncbi:RNA polymerase sigma factor [Gorillibacterium sp. sgz5001074]|uniref:RNA polymerase sigma factor n=1 Tax=Gorillibacterium sp. sgz5001074 TaxID=3446695 RepID=UPI003F681794
MPGTIDMEQVRPELLRYCLSMTGSIWDAEDLAQETLLRSLPLLQGERHHANPQAYLLRVARNMWTDQRRRSRMASAKILQLDNNGSEAFPDVAELEHAFLQLMECLTPLQRGVYLLKEGFGFSAAEVAEQLEMTEGAVKAALFRARQQLEAFRYGQRNEEPGGALQERADWRELLRAYVQAFRLGDVPGMLQLIRGELAGTPAAAAIVLNAAASAAASSAARKRAGKSVPGAYASCFSMAA